WENDAAAVTEIETLFSEAPRFTVHRQSDAGHNMSLGHTAADYHAKVFAFAADCVAGRANDVEKEGDLEAG
ncbi:alpha/beta hydrolase, partial [Mycobacterium kansasii]